MRAKEIDVDEDDFEELLTETWGVVDVCGMKYDAGHALKQLDPIAFRCAMADEPLRWECDECAEIFDDEDEANECCRPEPDEDDNDNQLSKVKAARDERMIERDEAARDERREGVA